MGVKPLWVGDFGSWNPHVIRKPLNEIKPRRSIMGGNTGPSATTEEFITKYNKAVELLRAIPGSKKLFAPGVPLAPALFPKFEAMEADDIGVEKFGGLPNLYYQWLYKPERRNANLEGMWPRCGNCHTYMSFLGQIDFGDWWETIHRLTCDGDRNFSYSSVGLGEDHMRDISMYERDRTTWAFWVCANACEHYYNSQFDAHVWTDHEPIYSDEMLTLIKERKPDPEVRAKKLAAAHEVAGNFYTDHNIKHVITDKKKVIGFEMRFDLDFGIEPWNTVSYKLEDLIEKVQEKNPDIFAYSHGRQFKIFGAPESQQEQARYFGVGYRQVHPYRLSPILCWDDEERDMTHQMYADVHHFDGEGRRDMFGKMDSSCT